MSKYKYMIPAAGEGSEITGKVAMRLEFSSPESMASFFGQLQSDHILPIDCGLYLYELIEEKPQATEFVCRYTGAMPENIRLTAVREEKIVI